MSVLDTPRIYFRGQLAWDPIVTNNYSQFYNEDTSEPVYPNIVNKVAAFRQEAIDAVVGGNWNVHGTHRSNFFGTEITGADLGDGYVAEDAFIGAPALMHGMLVDLEPYGTFTSQLFFDALSFGIAGGYRIAAPRNSRITSRYINFNRCAKGARAGVASVVWQACFAKTKGLQIDAYDSKVLQALRTALDEDGVQGITVQFNTYRTIYYDNPVDKTSELIPDGQELTRKLNCGGFQPNPARSMVVGVIGLWRDGEPANEPCDRTLIAPGPFGSAPTVSSLHARLTNDAIVLDLSNSISEDGLDLVKHNFGALSVAAVDPATNQPVTLATFDYSQYDREAYDRTSGIVTLAVDPQNASMAANANLQLMDATGKVLEAESQYRALPLIPNIYIDEGASTSVQFQVYDRGVPAGANVEVTIYVMSADASTVVDTFTLTTIANGTVSFNVTGTTGSITPYVAVPGPNPTPPSPQMGLDPQVYTFAYVRVLSADSDIASLPPTFENVYVRVLANWNAMAPCMDNWLDLANEAQVRAFGPMIKKLTNPDAFENFRYMPVTRDLTAGERTLLYNFLDSPVLEAMAPKAAMPEAKEQPAANLAKASRNMRS